MNLILSTTRSLIKPSPLKHAKTTKIYSKLGRYVELDYYLLKKSKNSCSNKLLIKMVLEPLTILYRVTRLFWDKVFGYFPDIWCTWSQTFLL